MSGKRTLHHQSQSGPFISIALHVCVSDFDPVCVCVCVHCLSLHIAERQTKRRREGVCCTSSGGVGVVFRVEKPRHGPGCTLLHLLQSKCLLLFFS